MSPDPPLSRSDNDGRSLFDPDSKYDEGLRKQQRQEGFYIWFLLISTLSALAFVAHGQCPHSTVALNSYTQRFGLAVLGGMLGGLVYSGKWLYHSIAKGLWHQDRRMWRFLSPWMSLGATIGIWCLMSIGFFPALTDAVPDSSAGSLAAPVGVGFVIGYLSDRCLAKMKDLAEVLFGNSPKRNVPSDGGASRET